MSRLYPENNAAIFTDSAVESDSVRTDDKSTIHVQFQQLKLNVEGTEERVKNMDELQMSTMWLLQRFFDCVKEIRQTEESDEGKKESRISMVQWLTRINSQKQCMIHGANTLERMLSNREKYFLEMGLRLQAYHKQFHSLLQKYKLQRTPHEADDVKVVIQESLRRISSSIQRGIQEHDLHQIFLLDMIRVRSLLEKEIKEHAEFLSML